MAQQATFRSKLHALPYPSPLVPSMVLLGLSALPISGNSKSCRKWGSLQISQVFLLDFTWIYGLFALSELYSSGQNPSGSEAEGGRFEGMAGGTKISRSVDFEDFPGGFPGRIGRFPMDFPVMFDCLNCHWLLDSQLLDFPLVIKLSNNCGTFTVRHGNLAMTMDEHRWYSVL